MAIDALDYWWDRKAIALTDDFANHWLKCYGEGDDGMVCPECRQIYEALSNLREAVA